MVAALLAFFLGGLGAHKFYLGRPVWGFLYLLFCMTGIPSFLGFLESIILLFMNEHDFNLKYNYAFAVAPGHVPNQIAQSVVINVPGAAVQPGVEVQSDTIARTNDLIVQLEKLNQLRVAGALTEEEFNHQKQKLLAAGGVGGPDSGPGPE